MAVANEVDPFDAIVMAEARYGLGARPRRWGGGNIVEKGNNSLYIFISRGVAYLACSSLILSSQQPGEHEMSPRKPSELHGQVELALLGVV